jgi:hypothetical protein
MGVVSRCQSLRLSPILGVDGGGDSLVVGHAGRLVVRSSGEHVRVMIRVRVRVRG